MNRLIARLACWSLVLMLLALTGCTLTEKKWDQQVKAGKQFLEAKDYARAILSFQNAVQLKPKDAETYFQLAVAHMQAGDPTASIAHLRKALEIDPNHAEASLRLAEAMTSAGERSVVEEAEQRLKNLLSANPGNVEALTALAIAEWKLARPEDAETHLDQAFRRSPGNLSASVSLAKMKVQRKDFDGAEQILRRAAAQMPPSVNTLVALGEFLMFRNRIDEAEAQFQQVLRMEPKHALGLMHTAALYVRRGQIDRAEQTYKTISGLSEKQYRSVYGIFLLQIGRREDAIRELSKLTEKYPRDRTARSALVVALINSGRSVEAERVLSNALAKNPKDNEALLQRSALYLSRSRTEDAYRDLTLLMQFRSDSAEAHYLLAKVHEQRSSPYNQRQELTEALRLRPAFLEARLELAMLFVRSGAAPSSLQLLNDAPESQKRSTQILTQRNWALLALGQNAEVRRTLDGILAHTRTSDLVVQHALLKLASGAINEAKASLREVLSRDPSDVRALELLASSFRAENQMNAGLKAVEAYVKQRPKAAVAQHFLGTLFLREGRLKEAVQAFESSKAADEDFTAGDLGVASVFAAEGKWRDAQLRLEAILAKTGENAQARYWLGNVHQKLGDQAAALEQYRKLLALDPNHVAGLNNAAFLLAAADATRDEAVKLAQKARELAPNNPAIENTLGWVLFRKGLYTLAIPHLERAVKAESTPRRQCHLGMAYLKSGDHGRGRQVLEVALRSAAVIPEAPDARSMLAQIN